MRVSLEKVAPRTLCPKAVENIFSKTMKVSVNRNAAVQGNSSKKGKRAAGR
jgi:hypothetical protein